MRKFNKLFIVIYSIIVGTILFNHKGAWKVVGTTLNYVSCGSSNGIPRPVPQLTTIAYTLLMTVTPIVLIIFSIFTLVKSIANGNAEEISKAKGKLIKKVIISVIIFFSASLVQFVINKVASNSSDKNSITKCLRCFVSYSESNCPVSDTGNDIFTGSKKSSNETYSVGTPADSKSNKSGSKTSSEAVKVLSNMMFAVETGGMVYGQQDYSNFGTCYGLSSAEISITIGAGGWMGMDAKRLLTKIRDEYPETFKKNDTNNVVANALDNKNWANYCITKGSVEQKAINAIITSDDGKTAQNDMMAEEIEEYIKEAESKGVTDAKAQAMYIDIRHVGGEGAIDRLLKHANKPYTLDELYKVATTSWPDDTGNPANGSMYKNRHDSFKKWAEEYL